MKLLQAHIDNFGKLSNFDLNFRDGLNVLQQPNGFGKSTLAAFLKAMFYGFSGKSARSLKDNERKKYTPWQGNRYGGTLLFETGGTQYKITRFFGKSSKSDRFVLYDLTHHRDSTDFSNSIGEELFGLDADSFARTVYFPQMQSADGFSTTSIQAKLSHLVDDTDDLNNFDSALRLLKSKRKTYRADRGNGGSVCQLQQEINILEEKLEEALRHREPLLSLEEEINLLCQKEKQLEQRRTTLSQQMQQVATQEARQIKQEQWKGIRQRLQTATATHDALRTAYPYGTPTQEEINEQRTNLATIQTQHSVLASLILSNEDRSLNQYGAIIFANAEQAEQDLTLCQTSLSKQNILKEQLHSIQNNAEEGRLKALSALFAPALPNEPPLTQCRTLLSQLTSKKGEKKGVVLSSEDATRLENLTTFFNGGIPTSEELAQWEDWQRQRDELTRSRENAHLTPQEKAELERLEMQVAAEEEKTASTPPPKKSASPLFPACLIVGVLCLVGGVFLLAKSAFSLGAVLSVLGFAVLLLAFWLYTKTLLPQNSSTAPSHEETARLLWERTQYNTLSHKQVQCQEQYETLTLQIETIQTQLSTVFSRFYPQHSYTDTFLRDLQQKESEFQELLRRSAMTQEKADTLQREIDTMQNQLIQRLSPYFPDGLSDDLHTALDTLQTLWQERQQLFDQQSKRKQQQADLSQQIDRLDKEIVSLLQKYQALDPALPPSTCLENLRTLYSRYLLAHQRAEACASDRTKAEKILDATQTQLLDFLARFGLENCDPQIALEQVTQDSLRLPDLAQQVAQAEKERDDFLAQNADEEWLLRSALSSSVSPQQSSADLANEDRQTQEEQENLKKLLLDKRVERDKLFPVVETLPALQDSLAHAKESYETDTKNCELLDKTIAFLQTAKDNLSTNYVHTVENGFVRYANRFLAASDLSFGLEQDLSVRLEQGGVPHALDSLSTGTAAGVQLCMRLALIDALFVQEAPFLVLDDPFVDLDDVHLNRALELLHDIAKEKQVLYLVCHSSRSTS